MYSTRGKDDIFFVFWVLRAINVTFVQNCEEQEHILLCVTSAGSLLRDLTTLVLAKVCVWAWRWAQADGCQRSVSVITSPHWSVSFNVINRRSLASSSARRHGRNLQGSADWNMLIYLPVHESEQPLWWLYQSHLAGKRRCPAVSLATRGTNALMHTGLCGLTCVSEDHAGVSAALVREWHPRLDSQHFPGHDVLLMWSLERVPLHGRRTSAFTGPKRNFTVC